VLAQTRPDLTQNKLTLGDPFCVSGTTPAQAILDGALASRPTTRTPSILPSWCLDGHRALTATPSARSIPSTCGQTHRGQRDDSDGKKFKVTKAHRRSS